MFVCSCANPDCMANGCIRFRETRRKTYFDFTIPSDDQYPPLSPLPKGCICPPGSESTCLRKDCGRK